GYSVAYYGVLSPDRVVKHSMIHFLLRGPFVGICVIILMLVVPRVESILGLPRDTMLIFSAMLLIVLLELAIELAEPFIDRLIYRQDLAELEWLQELDKRLLTTTDLKQFLENLLTALCELLRVRTGFVASLAGGKWQLETVTGDIHAVQRCLEEFAPEVLFHPPDSMRLARLEPSRAEFIRTDGFWVLPLRTRSREATLGLLGLYIDAQEELLSLEAGEAVDALIAQAEIALEDRHLQQSVFTALRSIIPEIERIQRWRGTVRYDVGEPLEIIKDSPVYAPEYQRWVKEALAHYWGGPKLSQSPLLNLRVVSRRLHQQETSPVNALRATLAEAIEALRPAGPRHMTASEWLLYNILEMRYIQGKRVRDIADTLAMSESDLYRKQRIAIEQVARVLADMERQAGEES
ncbi:MAG: histidine kinase N-terminal 7TM domain-containing protein, partial [Anaerolineae bacterium]